VEWVVEAKKTRKRIVLSSGLLDDLLRVYVHDCGAYLLCNSRKSPSDIEGNPCSSLGLGAGIQEAGAL
jgi:hypothetical protein